MFPEILPGADLIIRAIDKFLTSPAKGKSPTILASGPHGSSLIKVYEERLEGQDGSHLVPFALIPPAPVGRDDGDGGDGGDGGGGGGGTDGDGSDGLPPHIALIAEIATQFQREMPKGSGVLRLPLFDTIMAVLEAPTPMGLLAEQRRALRNALFERRMGAVLHLPAPDAAGAPWYVNMSFMLVGALARPIYGVRLRRRSLKWVSELAGLPGAMFIDGALHFTKSNTARTNHALVERLLLTALVKDLENATRRRVLSVRRNRRLWRFALLLNNVNDPGIESFVRNYLEVLNGPHISGSPLAVLGACPGAVSPFARPLPGAPGNDLESLALTLNSVLFALRDPEDPLRAYDLPLPADLQAVLTTGGPRNPLPVREVRFWDRARLTAYLWRCIGAAAMAVVVAAFGTLVGFVFSDSCWGTTDGQIIGVTDGVRCSLAAKGPEGKELKKLLELAGEQNAEIEQKGDREGGIPVRTIVFYAPVSVKTGSGNTMLNGIQSLRGALYAQHETNRIVGKDRVGIRLLIANPGDAFEHGKAVTKKIIEKKKDDGIVAVVGITQSRQKSLDAVRDLSAAGIPIIASSTTGSKMVDPDTSPKLFYQVSPTNAKIAEVMATFIEKSEQIEKSAGWKPGEQPKAILVYHPDDKIFSEDFGKKFTAAYGESDTTPIRYNEADGGDTSAEIAKRICSEVVKTRSVVVYVARAAIQDDLLNRMEEESNCGSGQEGTRIPFITEAVSSGFIEDTAKWVNTYPFLAPFFTPFNTSMVDKDDPYYPEFDAKSTEYFKKEGLRYRPSTDAAGAYDALRVASVVIDGAYGHQKGGTFDVGDVAQHLGDRGVGGQDGKMKGATGPITLGAENKFPPDKAVYMLGADAKGKITVMLACGMLPGKKTAVREWGPGGHSCPR